MRRLFGVLLPWLLGLSAPALAPMAAVAATPSASASKSGDTIIDDDRRALQLGSRTPRIVSLAPGATAMLFAAGAGAQIVGTSDFSNEPPAAQQIERVGDSQSFDLERILALHPDVVVLWGGGTSAVQVDKLERVGLSVYHHRIERLGDIPDSIRRLGAMAGTQNQAKQAAASLGERIAALRQRYADTHGGAVLIQVWEHPIYTVGGQELMSDVVGICGYRNAYADLRDPGPAVALESVLARDPDVILAVGIDQRTADEWAQHWRAFPTLRAVRDGRLLPWTDPRLSRLGPSMVDAAEALCAALAG